MKKAVASAGVAPKKRSKCLTCCIICLVILVVLTAIIIGASAIAFNKMVSPMIGGVKFGEALSLLSATMHANEKKIVTDPYTEKDLGDFYAELNSATFQKVKSEKELSDEYDALPQEDQDAISRTDYIKENQYTLTIPKILEAVGGVSDLIGVQSPAEETATAGDEEGSGDKDKEESDEEMLNKLIKQLNFDFKSIKNYNYLSDTEDEAVTTFQVSGQQVGALIGEVLNVVMGSLDLNSLVGSVAEGVDVSNLNLSKYFNIPQVLFDYADADPGENATKEQKDAYLKSVRLTATLKLDFRGFLNSDEMKAVAQAAAQNAIGRPVVGNVGLVAVKMFLPKKLFVTATIYPLDESRDMVFKINNYSEKNQETLIKLIDHFVLEDEDGNKRSLFEDKESEGDKEGEQEDARSIVGQLNAYVAKAFGGINDYVPLEFVPNKGNAQLKIAHVQMLLSLMKLYDPDDLENSVTPHMFMTTLRCLLDEATPEKIDGDLQPLYASLETRYGVPLEFWDDGHSLLDTDRLGDMVNEIDMSLIFNEENRENLGNDSMKVPMYQDQLSTLIAKALPTLTGGGETATAGDEGGDKEEAGLLDNISFDSLVISRVTKTSHWDDNEMTPAQKGAANEYADYNLAAKASIDLEKLLKSYVEGDNAIIDALQTALPKGLCFALEVKIRESYDEEGNMTHKVGKIEIEEGHFVNETGICINKFNAEYTDKVLQTISLMIKALGGGDGDSFDVSTLSDTIEEAFTTVFSAVEDNLYCSLSLGEVDRQIQEEGKEPQTVKVGVMYLPSLYEVVRGLSVKTANDSDDPEMSANVLSVEEIRLLFSSLYLPENVDYKPFTEGAADGFLGDLQTKYYLETKWTVDDIVGDDADISDKISADSIKFKDLYADTKTPLQLDVPLTADALADLINESGMLSDLSFESKEEEPAEAGEEEAKDDSFIKSVSIIRCDYVVKEDGNLYLKIVLKASFKEDKKEEPVAEAGDEEKGVDLDFNSLLPDCIYISVESLLYSPTGYHVEETEDGKPVRFSSQLIINEDADVLDRISKLLAIFADGSSIDSDSLTANVKDALSDVFGSIEDNINLLYEIKDGEGDAKIGSVALKNIFNTINKQSNKDDEEYQALSAEAKNEDDVKLAAELRGVGKDIAITYYEEGEPGTTADNLGLVNTLAIDSFSDGSKYTRADEKSFFDEVNDHYYIKPLDEIDPATSKKKPRITADSLETVEFDNNSLDFSALFGDTRTLNELRTRLTDARFAALANAIYPDGIKIDDGEEEATAMAGEGEGLANAKILQVRITNEAGVEKITLVIQVKLNLEEEVAEGGDEEESKSSIMSILPEYLYITAVVNRSDDYATTFHINNLTDDQTSEFFDRLNKLSESFGFEFDLKKELITDSLRDNIKDLFDNQLSEFGKIDIENGAIVLPNVFRIINDRSNENDENYEASEAEDQLLADELRGVGFAFETTETDGIITAVKKGATKLKSFDEEHVYTAGDNDAFFTDVNKHFYISDSNLLNASKVKSGVNINNDFVDFTKIYKDTDAYNTLKTVLSNERFAALAHELYIEGIAVGDGIGTAKILQVAISPASLKLVVQVSIDEESSARDFLPAYLYVTAVTDLTHETAGKKDYPTDFYINNLKDVKVNKEDEDEADYYSTVNFFNRIAKLEDAFGFEVNIEYATITEALSGNIKDLFDNQLSTFGDIEITNGAINLPNVFQFLVDGTYEGKGREDIGMIPLMDEVVDKENEINGYCYHKDGELRKVGLSYYYIDGPQKDAAYAGEVVTFNTSEGMHYFSTAYRVNRDVTKDGEGKATSVAFTFVSKPAGYASSTVNYQDVVKQYPEILMNSLREFGKADAVDEYQDNIYKWNDHAPSTTNGKYNTAADRVSLTEETLFYQRMQAYYFFNTDNVTINKDSFTKNDLFGSLKDDGASGFEYTFNLDGLTFDSDNAKINALYNTLDAAGKAELEAYISDGLYHYLGTQRPIVMSDKAMGSMANSQGLLDDGVPAAFDTLTISTFKLTKISETKLSVEITVEVTKKAGDAGSAMPGKFYLTATTVRDTEYGVGNANRYKTTLAINGMDDADVERLLNNLGTLSTFDVSSQLDTESIKKIVQDAVKDLFDNKLDKYVEAYSDGQLEFYSVYRQVVENLGIAEVKWDTLYTDKDYSDCETATEILNKKKSYAELDVQQALVKLHNTSVILKMNEFAGTETTTNPSVGVYETTDRAFAKYLSTLFTGELDYIKIKQGVFFVNEPTGRGDAAKWAEWEELINSRKDFEFEYGKSYTLVTAKITLTGVKADISMMPTDLHVSLIVDNANATSDNPLFIDDIILSNMTASEQALLMAALTDVGNINDSKGHIKQQIKVAFTALYLGTPEYDQGTYSVDPFVGKLTVTVAP